MLKLYILKKTVQSLDSCEFAEKLLKLLLNKYNCQVNIEVSEHGKPYLRDYPDLYFNISHTNGAKIFGISDQEIGVDIEKIKNFDKRIVKKFFTENEQAYVFREKYGQNIRFAEIWTKKEAYVKWEGKGLAIPFTSFDVLKDDKISVIYVDGYAISVCSELGTELKGNLIIYQLNDL